METRAAALRIASAIAAAAPITCSQLSSTISARLSRSHPVNPDIGLAPGREIPSTVPRALVTRSGSGSEASPTNQTPSSYDALTASATATATVVLPIPPGPTRVRSRRWASCAAEAAMISSRPTMRVSSAGKLPLTAALSGGTVAGCRCSRATGAMKL